MATTKQAAPAKKSEGFQGVRGAFWIIVVCAIIAFTLFFTWFGNDMHFQDPGVQDHPADIWGTIYKGGVIVPVIHTLLLTVLAMTIERWLALKTATESAAESAPPPSPMAWNDLIIPVTVPRRPVKVPSVTIVAMIGKFIVKVGISN